MAENIKADTIPKWLYRLESLTDTNGLWYNNNDEFVLGLKDVPNCKTKDLPMEYDERYKQDNKDWHSACEFTEDLTHWFSPENAQWLTNNGFVFTKYLAVDYKHYKNETIFLKETAIRRITISVEEVFPELRK